MSKPLVLGVFLSDNGELFTISREYEGDITDANEIREFICKEGNCSEDTEDTLREWFVIPEILAHGHT